MIKHKKIPPLWLLIIITIIFFSIIAIGIIFLFKFPFFLPIPYFWRLLVGLIFLGCGFYFLISALRVLTIKRAFGSELFKSKSESKLIITGIYHYTRNPLYLGAIFAFFGWTFIFSLTMLLIISLLFTILFIFIAKWEEKELLERFGEDYKNYKKSVPFIFPSFKIFFQKKGNNMELI